MKDVFLQLDEIAALPEDWDSQGANKISEDCIANTRNIIASIKRPVVSPEIYPNPNGTITLDWESDGRICSMEIGDTQFSAYWKTGDHIAAEEGALKDGIPLSLLAALESMFS